MIAEHDVHWWRTCLCCASVDVSFGPVTVRTSADLHPPGNASLFTAAPFIHESGSAETISFVAAWARFRS